MYPLENVKNVKMLAKLANLRQFVYPVGKDYIYPTKLANLILLMVTTVIWKFVYLAIDYVKHVLEEKITIVSLALKLNALNYKITHASVKLDLNCKIISVLKGTPLHLI